MFLRPTNFLVFFLPSVLAAFTRNDRICWRHNCIARLDTGTLCFEPRDNSIVYQVCVDDVLKNIMHVHLTSNLGRSIAYYDNTTYVLGAATWAIPHATGSSVYVCMTGQRLDMPNQYRTICRKALDDDDMAVPAAHVGECVSDEKPRYIGDGCASLGKPVLVQDDLGKEWYEQPALAGLFWLLGVLVTLETVCIWAVTAAHAVQARRQRLVQLFAAVFELLAHSWRRAFPPLPTQQHALQQSHNAATTPQHSSFALANRAATHLPNSGEPGAAGR